MYSGNKFRCFYSKHVTIKHLLFIVTVIMANFYGMQSMCFLGFPTDQYFYIYLIKVAR
jgi:hypothetical protein